jgi:hypothetical protein
MPTSVSEQGHLRQLNTKGATSIFLVSKWPAGQTVDTYLFSGATRKNDSGTNSIIPIPTFKYRISARVITLSLPNGSLGLNVLHINRKSLTRAFDRYTVVNMTHGVIFVRQTDDRQIDVAPFVFSCARTPMAPLISRQPLAFSYHQPFRQPLTARPEGTPRAPISAATLAISLRQLSLCPISCHLTPAAGSPWPAAISCN